MLKRILFSAIVLSLSFSNKITAQTFVEVTGNSLTPVYLGTGIWGDIDNDGDLDIFLTGWFTSSSGRCSKLYKNNGNDSFTVIDSSGIVDLGASTAAFCDFNNDGLIDLSVAGNSATSTYVTKLYKNNGDYTFTDIGALLPNVYSPTIVWADYDNDGDQDFFLAGSLSASDAATSIFRNDGNNVFTDINASMDMVSNGSADWGDFDKDGDLDLIVSGKGAGSWNFITRLYRNDGNDQFVNTGTTFMGVRYSSSVFGDYNNDGNLDIILMGETSTGSSSGGLHTKIYKGLGNGEFEEITTPLQGLSQGKAVFGDYDNDGDLDIIISGNLVATGAEFTTNIYRNNGNDLFEEVEMFSIESARRSSLAFGDYNNDGKLDVLLTGWSGTGLYMAKIYKNSTANANQTPAAPANLVNSVDGNQVTLSWDQGLDAETPENGLTYNLYIKKPDTTAFTLSPFANVSTGLRKIANFGNTGKNKSCKINNLSNGKYFYSVQTIDNGFAGSSFASVDSFFVGSTNIYDHTDKSITILSNYPNPFNNLTVINYELGIESHIKLNIYNTKGELVKELLNRNQRNGKYSISFDASGLNSGVYLYHLTTENASVVRKMLLVK